MGSRPRARRFGVIAGAVGDAVPSTALLSGEVLAFFSVAMWKQPPRRVAVYSRVSEVVGLPETVPASDGLDARRRELSRLSVLLISVGIACAGL